MMKIKKQQKNWEEAHTLICLSLDINLWSEIEKQKGERSRSEFVESLLEYGLKMDQYGYQ